MEEDRRDTWNEGSASSNNIPLYSRNDLIKVKTSFLSEEARLANHLNKFSGPYRVEFQKGSTIRVAVPGGVQKTFNLDQVAPYYEAAGYTHNVVIPPVLAPVDQVAPAGAPFALPVPCGHADSICILSRVDFHYPRGYKIGRCGFCKAHHLRAIILARLTRPDFRCEAYPDHNP